MDLSSMLNGSTPKSTSNKRKESNHMNNYHHQSPNMSSISASTINNNGATTSTSNNQAKDKAPLYQLNAALHLAISRASTFTPPPSQRVIATATSTLPLNGLLSSPFRPGASSNSSNSNLNNSPRLNGAAASSPASSSPTSCMVFGPSLVANPNLWNPKLSLGLVMKEQPLIVKRSRPNNQDENSPSNNNNKLEVQLKTHEVINRGAEPKVLLEDMYEIQGAYPRGFFVIMAKRNIQHNFVFVYPDNYWFDDLYGLRKSAYVGMRTAEGELYELHLKPSRDKQWLFGYLIKHVDMIRIVKESMNEIIYNRKLPLVLDLDDTLVRLVGEGNERYVPEADIPRVRDRVAILKDNRRVVLTERVHEFLEWAQNLYDISVCSLGDQTYVENVVNVLDPQRTRIRGILYSARSEHDYIKRSPDPGRPPKDLLALYSFCALKDKSIGSSFSLPLILDDETRMWPTEQHDNIIEVRGQLNTPVWSVSLFPVVQDTLAHVHAEFFRQFDVWYARSQEAEQFGNVFTRQPPSAVSVYKTYLRHILRDMIASGPQQVTPPQRPTSAQPQQPQQQQQPPY